MVDINIFIIHYVLTTVLDRLDVIDNFFFLVLQKPTFKYFYMKRK